MAITVALYCLINNSREDDVIVVRVARQLLEKIQFFLDKKAKKRCDRYLAPGIHRLRWNLVK